MINLFKDAPQLPCSGALLFKLPRESIKINEMNLRFKPKKKHLPVNEADMA